MDLNLKKYCFQIDQLDEKVAGVLRERNLPKEIISEQIVKMTEKMKRDLLEANNRQMTETKVYWLLAWLFFNKTLSIYDQTFS